MEPGTAPALLEFLESMRFMLRVEPEDVTGEYAVLSLLGPRADELAPAGLATMREPFGIDLLVPRDQVSRAAGEITAGGARLAGIWAYEALRIAAHRPRLGCGASERGCMCFSSR
jgi:folate-binding Fe-S cluster repair protein YgfZ